MSTTLTLTRKWGGVTDRNGKWQILIDGTVAGSIARHQTAEVQVEPGHHTLRVKLSDRFFSPERSFEATDSQVIRFSCHSQLLWPMYIVSLIKHDLWISLRQE